MSGLVILPEFQPGSFYPNGVLSIPYRHGPNTWVFRLMHAQRTVASGHGFIRVGEGTGVPVAPAKNGATTSSARAVEGIADPADLTGPSATNRRQFKIDRHENIGADVNLTAAFEFMPFLGNNGDVLMP